MASSLVDKKITNKGFQFLINNLVSQLWTLLIKYIGLKKTTHNFNISDILNFIFALSFSEPGRIYTLSAQATTASQKMHESILMDFADLGLVLIIKKPRQKLAFSPTNMIAFLVPSTSNIITEGHLLNEDLGNDDGGGGFLIIETNFRLYAYTSK